MYHGTIADQSMTRTTVMNKSRSECAVAASDSGWARSDIGASRQVGLECGKVRPSILPGRPLGCEMAVKRLRRLRCTRTWPGLVEVRRRTGTHEDRETAATGRCTASAWT